MKTKNITIAFVVFLLAVASTTLAHAAGTPVSYDQSMESVSVSSPLAGTKCRTDTHSTIAANRWGSKVYKYTVTVSWCYNGKKAWVTKKSSRGQVYKWFVSYKGDHISVHGNNTRYFSATGSAKFRSALSIPTPWGEFGPSRDAHPWVRIQGYYYGNVGKAQEPF